MCTTESGTLRIMRYHELVQNSVRGNEGLHLGDLNSQRTFILLSAFPKAEACYYFGKTTSKPK